MEGDEMIESGDLFEMANEDHQKFVSFLGEIQEYGKAVAAELGFPEYFVKVGRSHGQ